MNVHVLLARMAQRCLRVHHIGLSTSLFDLRTTWSTEEEDLLAESERPVRNVALKHGMQRSAHK